MFITIILFNLASTLCYLVCITYGTSLHGSNELQFDESSQYFELFMERTIMWIFSL